MKTLNIYFAIFFLAFFLTGCGDSPVPDEHAHEEEEKAPTDLVHLLQEQMDVMGIEVGSFQEINLKTTIKANGQLDLPPQNKASVSALMPGRVKTISVIEGNYVKKGQVLAMLEHPTYIEMQEEYLQIHGELQFLEQDYLRKKQLLADSIAATKVYQEAESKYKVSKAKLTALRAKFRLLGINIDALEKGEVTSSIAVTSPIKGYVRLVEVNMGMSIQPEQEMFEIVDNEHIHIDLMVYEKDIDRVKEGQKVVFSLTTKPNEVFEGKVFAIGKAFENQPKAVIVHAEIDNKTGNLLPGMYVDGRIETDFEKVRSLSDDAIVQDGGLSYIFVRETREDSHTGNGHSEGDNQAQEGGHGEDDGHGHKESKGHGGEYIFRKIEVNTGAKDIGFTEVVPAQKIPENAIVVTKGAYYLLAELKKGEGGGEHHH